LNRVLSLLLLLAVVASDNEQASLAKEEASYAENRVDFRYTIPWWQSAICLPDDSDKALVGKEGQLLLDFGNTGIRGFAVYIEPTVVGGAKWVRQQTASPRAAVVQTWKDAAGVKVLEETFVVTPKSGEPWFPGDSKRRIIVLTTLKNTTGAPAVRRPAFRIHSVAPAKFSKKDNAVTIGQDTRMSATVAIEALQVKPDGEALLLLGPVTLPPGASQQVVLSVDRHNRKPESAATVAEARSLCDAARHWWGTSSLPFETIQVPDEGIQAMIESSVRNIWQAREIKNGKPAFHVGPTMYRSLFVVDGAFLLESAAILDRAKDARAGVEYMLSHQKPDGSFEILGHYWKENGIVLWAATRHATLTQDKEWLRAQWPALQRVVKAIQNLRGLASKDAKALNYRLLPPGYVDGGIGGGDVLDYSNTQWCLAGLKAAIAAAHWLGDEPNAVAWQKEYDDFYGVCQKAAARDRLKDKHGNDYLPAQMGNTSKFTPQKGQWAYCQAVYPGQVFPPGDPSVESQLAMLRATKVEGMVLDTGWMKDGIWTYFASFYGHAVLWMGHGDEAAQVLYDFANHAVPTRVWREEQKPLGKGNDEVGDMPHNWASAEFVRLTAHLLELDRGDELHLLEGMPHQWLKAGMTTRLNRVSTPFGPLTMAVRVDKNGETATLEVKPLAGNCKAVVVHLPDGTQRRLPPDQSGVLTFPVR
jgi:hypothetical protein